MIEISALRTRFGKRLLLLFVALALVPIFTLAVVTYWSVTRELAALSEERLRGQAKAQTMAILERLALLEGELALLGAGTGSGAAVSIPEELQVPLSVRFEGLTRIGGAGEQPMLGGGVERPSLSTTQRLHLASGHPLLVLDASGPAPRILLARPLPSDAAGRAGELWSEVDSSYLWWGSYRENHLPPITELCIVQPAVDRTLLCSSGAPAQLPAELRSRMTTEALGGFSWSRNGEPHRARYRTLRLDDLYGHRGFTVILSEARARVGGPLRDFRLLFVPIVLATLGLVALLSIRQIRRSLIPLELLKAGTSEIAGRNFATRVAVSSGDEFEELAGSFNRMARRLGNQFDALSALTQIQSAVLSARDQHEIATAVLTRLKRLVPCRAAQLTVLDRCEPQRATTYSWRPGRSDDAEERLLRLEDQRWLRESIEIRIVRATEPLPIFLSCLRLDETAAVAAVPIVLESRVIAVLAAELAEGETLDPDDSGPVRQLADQVAQALSKATLIRELEELSLGTLSALARTIDANSKWTLGHSERVAELAIRLGRAIGLTRQELDTLERGALLHDIGKLGVPSSVLDKPSKLTAKERRMVEQHVEIGAQILEPVPSLADTLPLVRQHHEWYDGSGYLAGLAGEEIHPLARLLSVVDCYDALRSPRPYRGAVAEEEVRAHLTAQAGKQFDPFLVKAFLELLDRLDSERPSDSPGLLGALLG